MSPTSVIANEPRSASPDRWWRPLDWLCLVCLALAAWRLTASVSSYVDLGQGDETWYLHGGLMIAQSGLPDAQWGPLYSLWYWMLQCFQPDPIQLFYLNYQFLTAAATGAFYVAFRAAGGRPLFALWLASLYLWSPVPHLWPRVSQFALLVVLLGIATAGRITRPNLRWAVMTATFLLASFCRPEFFVAFLVAAGGLLLATAFRWRAARGILPSATVLLGCGALILVVGNPMAQAAGTNRSLVAFAQHYTLNLYEKTGSTEDPWTTCGPVVDRVFGNPHSLPEAVAHNPTAFLQHLWDNLRRLPRTWREATIHPLSLARGHRGATVLEWASMLALLALVLASVRRRRSAPNEPVAPAEPPPALLWQALALAAFATLPSVVIIYPRVHYFVVMTGLGLLFFFRRLNHAWRSAGARWVIVAALGLMLVTPDYFRGWRTPRLALSPEDLAASMPIRQAVQYLRTLHLAPPVRLLERDPVCYTYLGTHWASVAAYDKPDNQDFARFVQSAAVNAVLLNAALQSDSRYRRDASFAEFARRPESFGFVRFPLPGLDAAVCLRADLAASVKK